MKKDSPLRAVLVVAAFLALSAAILYAAWSVRAWACEGAEHPIRCILLR